MRFRLRTLLIVLAHGPMVLASNWFVYCDYVRQQKSQVNLGGVIPRIIVQPKEEHTLDIPVEP